LGVGKRPGILVAVYDGPAEQLEAEARVMALSLEEVVGLLSAAPGDARERKVSEVSLVGHRIGTLSCWAEAALAHVCFIASYEAWCGAGRLLSEPGCRYLICLWRWLAWVDVICPALRLYHNWS
jgi:hypothetical protein